MQHSDSIYADNPNATGNVTSTSSSESAKEWVLIARFSNIDTKNWMAYNGEWWYDITTDQGDKTSTVGSLDMITSAFWTQKGREIKITRTDDPTHTPLLVTTSNCLGDMTFREKISSYGNFRNGAVWSSEKCLGNCAVTYGGKYQSTVGFSQSSCDGDVLTRNKIGFWCDYGAGDGAVISIGGVGSACGRADHGLAVTEENAGKFGTSAGCDFGDYGTSSCQKQSYALNLWVQ
ncbi:hypothetical protein AC249_AIPGENE8391 [Exaiptasia diaphana]|nr:hypothetical protein AC249_AIPGENE8391 [Exaiptasia diaphana]